MQRKINGSDLIVIYELNFIFTPKILNGLKAVVTAGPSLEKIDPVRFISNFSSGLQGYEIANSLLTLVLKPF